jgi:hypothetical protein
LIAGNKTKSIVQILLTESKKRMGMKKAFERLSIVVHVIKRDNILETTL